LLESIRVKTAPLAIITTGVDFFFALASVVADELYAAPLPLIALSEGDFVKLRTDVEVQITNDGKVILFE
jgi:predicted aconitase with swiveling domain